MPRLQSRIDTSGPEFAARREGMLALVARLRALERRAVDASSRAAPLFAKRGQLLPRERVLRLLDPGAPWLELATLAGWGMDDADRERSIPGGAMIAGIGVVADRRAMVVASDAGIDAGAIRAGGLEKILRMQAIALEARLPFVHLVESAGANLLAYRVEGFVQGGALFHNLARLSAAGLPVITVVHGSSTAGGAYMPGLSDHVVMVRGRARAFLAGPPLLKAATGEIATDEALGGAAMHAEVSGLADHLAEDDADGLRIAREIVGRLPWDRAAPTALSVRDAGFEPPAHAPDELAGVMPLEVRHAIDMREVIARIVDASDFMEFSPSYGPATVCGHAAIHAMPVGVLTNNGPIDPDGATKATHFIQACCQSGTPLVFLQNTTGYLVGTEPERRGMIKHGSKMIQAVSNANVPSVTVMCGASFGAGNYGMCGRAFGPRFVFSWPNARTAVMGGEQAAHTMRIVAEGTARRRGEPVDDAALSALEARIVENFERQSSAFHTSARLLDDGVIDPRDTRDVLAIALATSLDGDARRPRPVQFGVARP